MKQLALDLSLKCLTFDYIGTNPDESSQDFGTIQVPESWRPIFQEQNTLVLLFGLLSTLPVNTPLAAKARAQYRMVAGGRSPQLTSARRAVHGGDR
jgi:hypothetical protein